MENQFKVDNRANTEIEEAVREARMSVGPNDFHARLAGLSQRGVPKAVIERIFVYRQCCRSTDHTPD